MTQIVIEDAQRDDLAGLVAIYNQAILEQRTAHVNPQTIDQRLGWFVEHEPTAYPILTARIADRIVGWVSLSPYRPGREALRSTVEVSYYVDFEHRGKGVGNALLAAALNRAEQLSYRTVFAIVLEDNRASVGLLERHGFKRWGYMPDVADFGDRLIGHLYYGRIV